MSAIDRQRALELLDRLWRWADREQVLPFTRNTATLKRLYIALVELVPPEDERSFSGPQRLKRAVLSWLSAFPTVAEAFFNELANRKDGRFPILREYHLIMAERSLHGEPELAPMSRDAAVRWVTGVEAEDTPPPQVASQALTPAAVIELLLEELVAAGQLMTQRVLWNRHEATYNLLPDLAHKGLVMIQGDHMIVTPDGLAQAPERLTDQLTNWVDSVQPKLADLDRESPLRHWSLSELAQRCGLSDSQMQASLLYRACFLHGLQSTAFDPHTGFPTATQLRFEIRLPQTSLMQRIASARSALQRSQRPAPLPSVSEVAAMAVPPTSPDARLRERLTNGDNPIYPAGRISPPTPTIEYGPPDKYDGALRDIDMLIMTATPTELTAMLRQLKPIADCTAVVQVHLRQQTYFVGMLGPIRVAVVMSRAGSGTLNGSLQTCTDAIDECQPRCVVAVGLAFGGYTKSLRIADVLVSTRVIQYGPERIQPGGSISRGSEPDAGITLLNRFRNVVDWTFQRPDGYICRKPEGPLLTGEKLIDDLDFKADLFRSHPDAIGGEMEASGVYTAAAKAGVEWIIIKAVCDWADGTKGDGHQEVAAESAASLVAHTMSREGVVADLAPPKLPSRPRTRRAAKPPRVARPVAPVVDASGGEAPAPDPSIELTAWIRKHCEAGTRLIAEELKDGPCYYFCQNGSSAFCDDFYARIDMWRTWLSALISGLRRRVKHPEHIIEDAQSRFADNRLLVVVMYEYREPSNRQTFDLRDRSRFSFGSGYIELRQWYSIGREDPPWIAITQGLRQDINAFQRLVLDQLDELEFVLPTGGK